MTASDPQHLPVTDHRSSDELRRLVEALFREHYTALCGFTTRYVKSRDIAEEVVQEVFLRVWEQCEQGDALIPSRAYLYAAVRNRAITILRHERVEDRHARQQASPSMPQAEAPMADSELALDELSRAARRAIAALPEQARRVFLLSREQGLSYTEIAAVLDLSVKTVESNMTRALKQLRRRLDMLGAIGLILHSTLRLLG